jgi:UDP-N-acetylmuramate: L-alanyl-gamma-D-glutamyl-meso-diaminopimelate ligase
MHIHILGICGTFMGGLAALAKASGHRVTGCDQGVYPPMSDQLQALGIELTPGFGREQLALQPDLFVVGNVVSRQHLANGEPKYPLMESILEQGLPYVSGPQWLSEHLLHPQGRAFHVMAVAGTHGKTTTSSMLAWILEVAQLKPGYLIGGVPLNFNTSARLPQENGRTARPLFVIEADEYDTAFFDKRSKFVHYRPRTAILNNLEFDHADIFDDLRAIERQFHHLVRTVPATGRLIVNAHEESLERVRQLGCWSEWERFASGSPLHPAAAQGPNAEWQIVGPADDFEIHHHARAVGRVRWSLSGVHNQLNALAAIAAAHHVGVEVSQSTEALCSFQNVRRRMELKGQVSLAEGNYPAVSVYDDFAHHPTAIQTTLEGLRRQIGEHARILCVFEPRSNTMKLGSMKSMLPTALASANLSFCHTQGLDWDAQDALKPLGERAQCADNLESLMDLVCQSVHPGDHIVCMSNGGFGGIHAKLLARLKG